MNSIDDVKRCVGEPVMYDIGGVQFGFYPLGLKDYGLLLKAQKMGDIKEPTEEQQLEAFTLMQQLITRLLKQAIPDITDELLDLMISKHYIRLQEIFVDIHANINNTNKEALASIEELKKNVQSA